MARALPFLGQDLDMGCGDFLCCFGGFVSFTNQQHFMPRAILSGKAA